MTADEVRARIAQVNVKLQQIANALLAQNPQANKLMGQREVYVDLLAALEEGPCSDSSQRSGRVSPSASE